MRFAWLFLCLAVVLGQTLATGAEEWDRPRAAKTDAGVAINEVLADPPDGEAGDANRDGERHTYNDEFVEIYNGGPDTVNLRGWQIADESSLRHAFPDSVDVIVMPGQFVTVFGGGEPTGFGSGVWVASSGRLSLNNTDDLVALISSTGDTVDVHVYGSEAGKNESVIRVPDGNGGWTSPSEQGWEWAFSPHEANRAETATEKATWGQVKRNYHIHG